MALASELSLDSLLQRLTELAAQLTGARYAALGVHRPDRLAARALHHPRPRRAGAGRDRRPAARPRDPRRADHRRLAAAPARDRRRPALGRLPAEPSADDELPRRAGAAARDRLRQPLPDREAGRRRLHRGRPGARRAARLAGRRRDRERAPVRVGDPLVAAARVADRGQRARSRARPTVDRLLELVARAAAGAAGRAGRRDRAARRPGPAADRDRGRRGCGRARRDDGRARRLEGGPRARAPPQRAGRLDASTTPRCTAA